MSNNKKSTSGDTPKSDATNLTPVSLRSSNLQSLIRPGAFRKAPPSLSGGNAGLTPTAGVPSLSGVTQPRPTAPKAKPKSSMIFAPNVNKQGPATPGFKPGDFAGRPPAIGGSQNVSGASLQSMLAHRLAVQSTDNAPIQRRQTTFGGAHVVNTDVSNKMAAYNAMRRKKKDAHKSRDILELSWAPEEQKHDITLYTPISLPYVMRASEDDDQHAAGSAANKSQRPTLKKVDEANRNAAPLFAEEDDEDTFNWILIQFPSILPAMDRAAMEAQTDAIEAALKSPEELASQESLPKKNMIDQENDDSLKYMPTNIAGLPEGFLGELLIHQSGKVLLQIGDHQFDVNTGSDCNFNQEVGCYVPENSEFFFMGNCFKRMIVTPAVDKYTSGSASK